jgi:hypothetical protein
MDRLRAVLVVLVLSVPLAADAAEVTRIASSFEDNDPLGLYVEASAQGELQFMQILREQLPGPSDGELAQPALNYTRVETRLNLDVFVGLYRDLELRIGLPFTFQTESWGFPEGISSTVRDGMLNNCLQPDGRPFANNCVSEGTGAQSLFELDGNGNPRGPVRLGLGNARFGLRYAIFQQHKDETKPTLLVGFDYEAPTGPRLDPRLTGGGVGDRVHKYMLHTALSRRYGVIEPYFRAQWTIPVRGPGAYSNCDSLDPSTKPFGEGLGHPGNCGNSNWLRRDTAIQAPMTLGTIFGAELTLLGDPTKNTRLKADLRGTATWVSEGRYYNAMSGLLRKLLYSGDYLQFGGQAGATLQHTDIIQFRFAGSYLYTTGHPLTAEPVGKDLDNNGELDTVGPGANPSYDYRTDFVSRRFYAASGQVFRLDASVIFGF